MADIEPEMKVVLYGRAGTGKTTLAASFPKPLLILDCSEKGTDSVRDVKGVKVLRVLSFQQVKDIYWAARKGKLIDKASGKKFATLVLDTASGLQSLVIRELKEKKGQEVVAGSEANWGSMTKRDWGDVASTMKEWINNVRDLEDMNIVFIAHDRVFGSNDDEDDEEGRIDPVVGPSLSPSVASTLNAAVNTIGNTFIREYTVEVKLGKGKKKKKRKVVYCLRVGPHALYVTKIRKPRSTEIPAVIEDPSYDDLLEYIDGDK